MVAKSRAEAMKAVEAIFERYDDAFLVRSLLYSIHAFPCFSVLFELPIQTLPPCVWPQDPLSLPPTRASQTNDNTGIS